MLSIVGCGRSSFEGLLQPEMSFVIEHDMLWKVQF